MEFGTRKAASNRNVERCGRCGAYVLVTRKKAKVTCGSCGQQLKVDVKPEGDDDEAGSASPKGEPVPLDFVTPNIEAKPE